MIKYVEKRRQGRHMNAEGTKSYENIFIIVR